MATLHFYKDTTTCQAAKLAGTQSYGVGCALSVTEPSYYYDDNDTPPASYSTSLSCTSRIGSGADSLQPPGPLTDAAKKYSTQR
jgi:hypothetical protein